MYHLLISGQRSCFTTLNFDDAARKLNWQANYDAPYNASWIEPSSSSGTVSRLIGLSEGNESGLLYTFDVDHDKETCRITSQQPTKGAPAHFVTLKDKSALALATYLGGSIALYPISIDEKDVLLLNDLPHTEVYPTFPYQSTEHGPDEKRQRQCHIHQIIEDRHGLLYAPDLGSDRVWILHRNALEAEVCGWLQCPSGTGPRHGVMSSDDGMIYIIGELSHNVIAFDVSTFKRGVVRPIEDFCQSIIPPWVSVEDQAIMDSAEICLHKSKPNVLYVSNRMESLAAGRANPSQRPPFGDSISIVLLSANGRKVEGVKHVCTGLDIIRGMRFSPDGKYMAAVGQERGGVQIYAVAGIRGDEWSLVTSLEHNIGDGIKHVVWL